jgi:hypothetical protein
VKALLSIDLRTASGAAARPTFVALAIVGAVIASRPAAAQPDGVLKPDLTKCNKAEQTPSTTQPLTVAPSYKTYEITGELVDPPQTVRALLDPTMRAHPILNEDARKALADAAAKIGYELIGVNTVQLADDTTRAHIFLAPRLLVRRVDVDVPQGLSTAAFVTDVAIDDEVRRHMQIRKGVYLPWKPLDRACALLDEMRYLEDFLRTEGYFEAKVKIDQDVDKTAIKLTVTVDLGPEYRVGQITIADTGPLAVDTAQLLEPFHHTRYCVFKICFGSARFTRKQHEEDKKKVIELFQNKGLPAVRVTSDVL